MLNFYELAVIKNKKSAAYVKINKNLQINH